MLAEKRIALTLCCTDLLDDYVPVVPEPALLLPLCGRASGAFVAHPARLEEVFRAAPGTGEEVPGKRPGFVAHLALPPGQVRFARA